MTEGVGVDAPSYKSCVDAIADWGAARHMWQRWRGGFQIIANRKDTPLYYLKLTADILIMAMRG